MSKEVNEYILFGGSGYFGSNFRYSLNWLNSIVINIDFNKYKYSSGIDHNLQLDLADKNNVVKIFNTIQEIERVEFNNPYFKKWKGYKPRRILINFAAQSFVDTSIAEPSFTLNNNINIVLNMLKLADLIEFDEIIHISTDEVHILDKKDIKFVSPYALSKKICEDILLNSKHKIKIVRPVNLYGIITNSSFYRQKNKCIITKLIDVIKHPEDEHSFYLSDSSRHFMSVGSAINQLEAIINLPITTTKIFLLEYDFKIKIKDLINQFNERYFIPRGLKFTVINNNVRGKFEDPDYEISAMEANEKFKMDDFWDMINWMLGN